LISKNNQSNSIINSQYAQFGFKANVENLTSSINQSIKDIVFETNRNFCKSDLADSSKSNHNTIDKLMKSRVNSSNDSVMTVTVYYYNKGSL